MKKRAPLLHRISLKLHLGMLFALVATIPVFVHLIVGDVTGWTVATDLGWRHDAGLGVGLLLATVVGLLLAERLTRMLRRILDAMDAVAAGHYEKRAEVSDPVVPAEILRLTRAFNRMSDEIDRSRHANRAQLDQIRVANAQHAELDQLKSDLIDAVSHEFRTPLTSIKGYAATMLRKDAPFDEPTRRRLLKVIKDQADRLNRLVDDLLTIPKLDKGEVVVTLQPVALLDCLSPTLALFPDRQVSVMLPETLPLFMADPDRLEQVMVNLVENAHKYSAPDAPIQVSAAVVGGAVAIRIHNPCDPIDPVLLERLFTKFYRLDNRLTRTSRGTGLGLYLTKGLIDAMGGTITASAADGFAITFALPLAPQAVAAGIPHLP
ncbi:MAG: HAMP domain-containing protein [Candidatus Sericytochromatia bacterium]|nr:HAMP domain-containing protein [Candidatus Sericytochromatia bacterium]